MFSWVLLPPFVVHSLQYRRINASSNVFIAAPCSLRACLSLIISSIQEEGTRLAVFKYLLLLHIGWVSLYNTRNLKLLVPWDLNGLTPLWNWELRVPLYQVPLLLPRPPLLAEYLHGSHSALNALNIKSHQFLTMEQDHCYGLHFKNKEREA